MRRLSLAIAATLACAAPPPGAPGWRILGPGGGGSVFHPTVSPHDSRTALVACDMTGSYLTRDGGATWRIFNLGERSEEHTSELQSLRHLVCRLLLEKKNKEL